MALVLSLGMVGFLLARPRAEDPAFVKNAFVGGHFFVGFVPRTTAWVCLQRSEDCATWTDVASVATTNGVTEFVHSDVRTFPRGFYRLRSPCVAVQDARERWSAHVSGDYQFQLEHVRSPGSPAVLTGRVAVGGGRKTVTDTEGDGQPIEPAELDAFPSVEELFSLLDQAQAAGCWRVAVIHDPALGYPVWCVIERVSSTGPKQIDLFRISGLKVGAGDDGG